MNETTAQAKDLDTQIASTAEEITGMRAELSEEAATPLSWDEITSTTVEEVGKREQRRGILPRLIRAGEIKLAQLRIRRHEVEMEATEAERSAAYERLEKAMAAEQRAKERRQAAHGEWNKLYGLGLTQQDHIRRLRRELRELQGDDAPAPVQDKPEPPAPTRYAPLTDPRQVEAMRRFYVMTDAGGDDDR